MRFDLGAVQSGLRADVQRNLARGRERVVALVLVAVFFVSLVFLAVACAPRVSLHVSNPPPLDVAPIVSALKDG